MHWAVLFAWTPVSAAEPDAPEPIVLAEIRELEAPPGTESWDRAVAFHLLVAYDRDRSGALDRGREVDALPCEVWMGLDRILAERSEFSGLLVTYGFREDLVWIGHVLGFSRRMQRRAEERMRGCGVTDAVPVDLPPPDERLGAVIAGMISMLPDPGSPAWYSGIRDVVSMPFDEDDSGSLDRSDELGRVPCRVWTAIDGALKEGDGAGLWGAVWSGPDGSWSGERIGVSPSLSHVFGMALVRCGVLEVE